MKHFCWLVLVLALLLPGPTAMAGTPLRIATEGAYPPFNDVDKDGNPIGFDVDIARALCRSMGVTCTVQTVKWDDLLPGLAAGNFDVIVASMARTEEREKVAAFTKYYYRSRSTFVGDPGTTFIQTREGLAGKTLAAQDQTVQAAYLQDKYAGSSTIRLTKTNKEALDLLAKGKVDAVLSDSLSIFVFLQSHDGREFDFVGTPLPVNDPSSEARIAVRKEDTELLDALNAAIKSIRMDGTYDKINRKYFPFSIY